MTTLHEDELGEDLNQSQDSNPGQTVDLIDFTSSASEKEKLSESLQEIKEQDDTVSSI